MSRILVTGANGFLGAHIVKEALDSGFRGARYSDVTAIIHSASPFVLSVNDPKKDLLEPAIEGTLTVLRAAQAAGIKRVVVTSSVGAVPNKPEMLFADVTYGPEDWLPVTYEQASSGQLPGFVVYLASKKFAELAAWDFAKEHPELKLTTINPTLVYGPVIHPISSLKSLNTSNLGIYSLINGSKETPPDSVPTFCDVVSTAKIHVKALESESVVGKRVLFSKGPATIHQILKIIAKARPELADRLPSIPEVDPLEGKTISRIDSSLAMDTLGVKGLDLEETVLQTVDSLLELERQLGTN
ncbi:NAD(P)-binding protein [Gymnopus androsaceus JB14]|uniref:NAD(P)-binding protein n=1 Tax=Gymnopus androsaceus JB14 TaxID=1447944 RepID=A0A6A4H5J0_9AGAR|nr:NAD(P)-binding protein [Gymnopus androsaceus JB14]